MTVLQELVSLYERRAAEKGWSKPGYSPAEISGVIVLEADGKVRDIQSLLAPVGKGKLRPRIMHVPKEKKRTVGIKPNLFWDKSAYTLGVTETDKGPGQKKRTLAEHEAFRETHLNLLENIDDPTVAAFRSFLKTWEPENFSKFQDSETLVDGNLVFRNDNNPEFIHELACVRAILESCDELVSDSAICLVTGEKGAPERLHPTIKGVMGAQSSGASLVSFNKDADTSFGKSQGSNAPVSGRAAFMYGTALNALLAKGSGRNVRIGGDTTVFWAEQPETDDALQALLTGSNTDAVESRLRDRIISVAQGRLYAGEKLDPKTRLFVIGLAPNAARLSVRYWYPGTLRGFSESIVRFWNECDVSPSPFMNEGLKLPPKLWVLLHDLAAQDKKENIPHGLGGDLMRAVLTGGPYPVTLLSTVLGRIRVEGEPDPKRKRGNIDGRRAAMIRAVLRRNLRQEIPMEIDGKVCDPAYLLGRLFGAYAYAEKSYQNRGADLRQKYIGAASATPARVFPILMRGYEHNLASLLKAGGQKAGSGVRADKAVTDILGRLPDGGDLPATLSLEGQGRFFIGFYHQTSAFYMKSGESRDNDTD